MSLSRVSLAAAAVVLAVAGCGASEEPADTTEANTTDTVSVMIRLVTDTGNIAVNYDDVSCVWMGTAYTLRDSGGEIIAAGDVESDLEGEAEVGGETGLLAEVRSEDPYECGLPFTIPDVPRAEFYELEVSTMAPHSQEAAGDAEVAFEASEALSGYFEVEVGE